MKLNEFWLIVESIFGGLNPEGVKLFVLYKNRAKRIDRTDYIASDSSASHTRHFAPHWAQLLSASIVGADARRSIAAIDKEREKHMRDVAHRVYASLPASEGAARGGLPGPVSLSA